MLNGKKVIAIGERDGVPGAVIAECLEGAGLEVVFRRQSASFEPPQAR